jgi:cytochrome c-type biogenesis protein CcmH/NrfG
VDHQAVCGGEKRRSNRKIYIPARMNGTFSMDRLDKISVAVIAVLAVWAMVLVGQAATAPVAPKKIAQQAQAQLNPEYTRKLKVARDLMENNNLQKAEELAMSLVRENPYIGSSYMILGDIRMRKQELVKAMFDYKNAVELNPDFLDKKTDLFQGKKIRVAMEEVLAFLEDELRKSPGDARLKEQKKTLYYMQRKLAGSCG